MKPLALIPARAGSKRLPGKNRQMIGDLSLAENAVSCAWGSELFDDRIFVSTDDPQLPLMITCTRLERPAALAQDDTPMIAVVRDVVVTARSRGVDFDSVVLLQPTSPLRTPDDIRACARLLAEPHVEALVSVVETRSPEIYTLGHAGRLRPVETLLDGRRLMVPNGAVFAIRTSTLDQGLDWWSARIVYAHEMPPDRSVDIDTEADLERARALWSTR